MTWPRWPRLSRLVDEPRQRVKYLGALIIIILLTSGALLGSTGLLGYSSSAVAIADVGVRFLNKPISPDQDPCTQVDRRPLVSSMRSASLTAGRAAAAGYVINEPPRLDPLTKAGAVRESDAVTPKPGVQQAQTARGTQICRQPETSAEPTPTLLGKVISPEGNTGDVSLDKRVEGYVLTVANIRRAGKYTGRVSSDVIAPYALQVTLNVSDWWPYFFVAVALGIVFSNYTFKQRAEQSLPHGETAGANREVAEAFAQGVNSGPVTTVSSLAAVLIGLYASYSGIWGLPVDYVAAFLGGAAVTLGLRTMAGAANAAATRLERALKKEPPHFVNEVHFQPPPGHE